MSQIHSPLDDMRDELAAMHNSDLGQTMILNPGIAFHELVSRLHLLGFKQETIPTVSPQLLNGEPSAAVFSHGGKRPYLVYSFNPVVRLRVLDIATTTPLMRKKIAQSLPQLSQEFLRQQLLSKRERDVLHALWSLVELEDIHALRLIEACGKNNAAGPISQEASFAIQRLTAISSAREKVLGGMRIAALAAQGILASLPDVGARILAKPNDAYDLFTDDVAGSIALALQNNPLQLPTRLPKAPDDCMTITAAPAGLLRWDNMLSRKFPTGYRNIAGWLKPDVVWVSWRGSDIREQSGPNTLWDGLVFLGTRWVWFPKVYRHIGAELEPTQSEFSQP